MNNEENEDKPNVWHTERDFTWVLHMLSEEGVEDLRVQAEIQGRGEPGTVVTIEKNNCSVEIPIHMIEPLEDLLGNIRRTARMKPFPCLGH